MLRLGGRLLGDDRPLVMAVVNRTPDSFFAPGATWAEDKAFDRVGQVVDEGADIVDIGGVRAGNGPSVDAAEEIRRVASFVGRVRAGFPELLISVDTWRSVVGRQVCGEGADIINDAWGGHDRQLAEVAAEFDAALVCTHTGGLRPRTDPHRIEYADVVRDCIDTTVALAERAVAAGVHRESVMIDPAHDFGKNTFHSLEITRRLGEMVATGWPVLVSVSNKDFVGETLGLPAEERLAGSLAAAAVSALAGARVFRAHQIRETRQVVDMVWSIAGRRPPAWTIRGLA